MKILIAFLSIIITTAPAPRGNLKITFNFQPEVKDSFKIYPILLELQGDNYKLDTNLINPGTLVLENIPSDVVWIDIFGRIKCTDGVSNKYFRGRYRKKNKSLPACGYRKTA